MELTEIAPETGCFYVWHPMFPPERCAEVLADARAFFALPHSVKQSLSIEGSPHFRGYSEMRNERDWREQIHFGREELASDGLRGPNLWPPDPHWRERILKLITDLELAGREILDALAHKFALPKLMGEDEAPYLLLKMIHYQPPNAGVPRSGVAPHVDFSWITLLIQDDTGGLEIRALNGSWIRVPQVPGALVVNVGEILEFASRGHYRATPHRVVNRSRTQSRVSLPFFLNPSLDKRVKPAAIDLAPGRQTDTDHVHRVFPTTRDEPFLFGEQEWRRKGLGIWCAECVGG